MPFNGKRLAERRTELALTQWDVSERTRVHHLDGRTTFIRPDYLSKYENGKRTPDMDAFMLICRAVALDPRELWIYE